MTEHKFTDEEVIKALEICAQNTVGREGYFTYQGIPLRYLCEDALDLIKRQKVEIAYWLDEAANSKKEAVKEFAKRLKEKLIANGIYPVLVKNSMDKLLKEMTEEEE